MFRTRATAAVFPYLAVAAAQSLDWATTTYALLVIPGATEGNPLMALGMSHGAWGLVLFKAALIAALWVGVWVGAQARMPRMWVFLAGLSLLPGLLNLASLLAYYR